VDPRLPIRSVVLTVVSCTLLSGCGVATSPAATVGSTTITDEQVAREAKLLTFFSGLQQQPCAQPDPGPPPETSESACSRVTLSYLIQATLLEHYAAERSITVSDDDVQKALSNLEQQLGSERLTGALSTAGLSRADLEAFARESLIGSAVENDVMKTKLGEAKLHDLYERNIAQFTTVDAEHILVKTKAEADDVYAQVTAPGATAKDFEALAKTASTDKTTAANGGELGTQVASSYVPPFATAVAALEPGEISQPVHTQFGWHVIRLVSKEVTPFDQALAQLLQGQDLSTFQDWLAQQAAATTVSVNPRYGRLNRTTLAIDRITSTDVSETSIPTRSTAGSPRPSDSIAP
jgi:foldase protein PrsA